MLEYVTLCLDNLETSNIILVLATNWALTMAAMLQITGQIC